MGLLKNVTKTLERGDFPNLALGLFRGKPLSYSLYHELKFHPPQRLAPWTISYWQPSVVSSESWYHIDDRNVKWTERWGIPAYGSVCVIGLSARVFHWAVEICWRMNLQMTKATTMQSCGQTIRMGGWQWPQGIWERTRHIKVKHLYWVMPAHWKEWIGANARLSHNIVCESLQSHWCAIFL